MIDFSRRRILLLWQFLFITLATTWIWAPQLNHVISYRSSLISQYETGMQPYGWLFRIGDIAAASLLGLMAYYYTKVISKTAGYMLAVIAAGCFIDPILTTNCQLYASTCIEHESVSFVLHAIETVLTAGAIFAIGVYDIRQRRRLVTLVYVIFQIVYLIFSFSQIATINNLNTITQVAYQALVFVWLAWYCRDNINTKRFSVKSLETNAVRYIAGAWGLLNGFLALLLSFYHSGILGNLDDIYFVGDNELLAQYGIIIGVTMLYLSRHLLRGEERARQIFLVLVGIETLKYSVLTPHAGLLAFYFLSFCALFVLQDDFDRGVVPVQFRIRLKEAGLLTAALAAAGLSLIAILYATHSRLTLYSLNHFFDNAFKSQILPHTRYHSLTVAHLMSAFIITSLAAILWTLFRPIRPRDSRPSADADRAVSLLNKHARSSEDFFKLWPKDKQYFWSKQQDGFIAYKIVGAIVFAVADPITTASKQALLLQDFIEWSKAHRLTACFLPIYSEHSRTLYETAGLQTLQMGSSAIIKTAEFTDKTFNDKWWRWQKNRAKKAGYIYKISLPPHSNQLMKSLKSVSDSWLAVGGHEERGFALGYFDKQYLQQCAIHYLDDAEGQLMAFTNQLPVYPKVTAAGIDLLRYRPEANNTMPYLLSSTIEYAQRQGYTHFDLGFVPFAASDERVIAIAKIVAAGRFSSAGLEQFKNKFKPEWQPTYLAYDGDIADLARIAINLEGAMKL